MAAGRAVVAVAACMVAVAAALPLLADGAYADCYNYCFNDCISKDKSMRDYCSYACDKTCAPDGAALWRPTIAAGCQFACARDSCHRRREGNRSLRHACVHSVLHTAFSPDSGRFQFEHACTCLIYFLCNHCMTI